MIHDRDRKVKYSNRNNFAAGFSIALKFGTEFDHGKAGVPHMFKVIGQRSRSQGQNSRSQRNYATETDKLSEFRFNWHGRRN